MDAMALLESTGALLPHMTVLVTGLVILTLDLFLTPRSRYLNEVVGLAGLLLAFFFTLLRSCSVSTVTYKPSYRGRIDVTGASPARFLGVFMALL